MPIVRGIIFIVYLVIIMLEPCHTFKHIFRIDITSKNISKNISNIFNNQEKKDGLFYNPEPLSFLNLLWIMQIFFMQKNSPKCNINNIDIIMK